MVSELSIAKWFEAQAAALTSVVKQSVPIGKLAPRTKPLMTSWTLSVDYALRKADPKYNPEYGKWR
jgi:hypothetical protein